MVSGERPPASTSASATAPVQRWTLRVAAVLALVTLAAFIVGITVSSSRNASPAQRHAIEQLLRVASRATRERNYRLSCTLYDPAERTEIVHAAQATYHEPGARDCVKALAVIAKHVSVPVTIGYAVHRITISGNLATAVVTTSAPDGRVQHDTITLTRDRGRWTFGVPTSRPG
jgi:hypothetical protein